MQNNAKLTTEVQRRIVQAISAGNYYEPAAVLAGINRITLWRWIKRGEKEIKRVEENTRTRIRIKEKPYVEFYKAIQQAQAIAEIRVVTEWQKQLPESWQACRDFLARRYPERWSSREKHEISGIQNSPIEMNISINREETQKAIREKIDSIRRKHGINKSNLPIDGE